MDSNEDDRWRKDNTKSEKQTTGNFTLEMEREHQKELIDMKKLGFLKQ
jgi:hypothetical protein